MDTIRRDLIVRNYVKLSCESPFNLKKASIFQLA